MKIELVIYLLGCLTGISFGVVISMIVDYITSDTKDLELEILELEERIRNKK